MHSFFLVLTIIQGFVSQSIGIISILKGGYKPQRMTRFIYLLMSALFVGTLYFQGSRDAIFLAAMQGLGTIFIFFLSLKYGMGGFTTLDIVTLIGFLISLSVWKLTSSASLALYFSIITDAIGFIPTLEKTWKFPETEEWKFYFSDVLAGAFSLLSLTVFSFENTIFPLYIFILNLSAVVLILSRRRYINAKAQV